MTIKRLGSVLFFILLCAPVVSLAALTLRVSQLRNELVQQEAKVLNLGGQLGAASRHIERMEADVATHALQREEAAKHDARAVDLIQQLADAHSEIARLQAEV